MLLTARSVRSSRGERISRVRTDGAEGAWTPYFS